jgi:hypothetical protein
VKLLGFLLELLEATLGITIDGILGLLGEVELDFELLRGALQTLLETFETHGGRVECGIEER